MSIDELIEYQRQQWHRGTPADIDDLLSNMPLSHFKDQGLNLRLSLICNEIALRESSGQTVSAVEYMERFPDLRNELLIQWEVDRLFELDVKGDATTAALRKTASQQASVLQPPQHVSPRPIPKQIGRYEILRELGRGAMGVAYEAWDPKLKRNVAIKRLRAGETASDEELARIRSEAEAVAKIDHENIVKIFDIGEEEGNPFFAMELCTGGNLSTRLAGKPLPPKQAAEIVRLIANGVSAAHARRIIHRDLKPSNVLLRDAESLVPKITDFGLAKSLDKDGGETATGFVLGTPAYMPPEQATGQAKLATVAMDVYALGTVLYECLTARPPFQSSNVNDVLEQVRNTEPISVRRLEPKIPFDLETIVNKCMRKEPAQRYANAQQVADDLQNFLSNKPILARRQNMLELAIGWGKRNPMVALLVSSICMIITASLIVLSAMFFQVKAESTARMRALADRDVALQEKSEALAQREAVNRQLQTSEALAQRRYYSAQISLAQQALNRFDYARAEDLLESVTPKPGGTDLRGFEWNYLKKILHQRMLLQFDSGDGEVLDMDVDKNRNLILVTGGTSTSGFACVRNYVSGETVFSNTFSQPINGGAFDPTGNSFIICRGDGVLYVYDFANPLPVKQVVSELEVRSVAWSPDGKKILIGSESGEIGILNASTFDMHTKTSAERGPILRMFFSDDSQRFYTSVDWGKDGKHSTQWEFIDNMPTARKEFPNVSLSDESSQGQLVVGMDWGNLVVASAQSGEIIKKHPISAGPLLSVRFNESGDELYIASRNDREVRHVSAESLETIHVYPARHTLAAVAFPVTSGPWASGDAGGEVRIWGPGVDSFETTISDEGKAFHYAAFDRDSDEILLSSNSETMRWNPMTGETKAGSDIFNIVASSKDASTVVSKIPTKAGENTTLEVYTEGDSQPRTLYLSYPIYEHCLALSDSGKYLATRGEGTQIEVFDLYLKSKDPVYKFDAFCVGMAFSHDDNFLACGTQYGQVRLFDLRTGERLPNFSETQTFWAWGMSAVFSHDGKLLASGNESGTVKVWRTDTRELVAQLTGNQGELRCLAFFPDGKRLVSSGSGDIRIWDIEAGQELLSLPVTDNRVAHIAVNPAGNSLLAISPSGRVQVWDAASADGR